MPKIKPERLDWQDLDTTSKHDQNTPAGTIAAAIVIAALIIVGGWIGYTEYKEYQLRQELNQLLNGISQIFHPPATPVKVPVETKAQKKERQANCRFWAAKIVKEDTPENRMMVEEYCYGPGGRDKAYRQTPALNPQSITRDLIRGTAKPIQDAVEETFKANQKRREALMHEQKQQREHARLKAQLSEQCAFWQDQAPSERRTKKINRYCI
ncbi:hypothetical protein [Alcanivorax sp.]|jgi:hypothetical protein|uniref:hypothetical protein n=1 Tax=Alcanivorax sp. TaxID=1872427 RepID=UPI0032D8B5F4